MAAVSLKAFLSEKTPAEIAEFKAKAKAVRAKCRAKAKRTQELAEYAERFPEASPAHLSTKIWQDKHPGFRAVLWQETKAFRKMEQYLAEQSKVVAIRARTKSECPQSSLASFQDYSKYTQATERKAA